MQTLPLRPAATEADLLALPEEGRGFELIAGALVEKHAGFRHGRAQLSLGTVLGPYHRRSGRGGGPGGWWLLTEQLVRLGAHTLRPDLCGFRRERLPEPPEREDAVVTVPPDWVCEILSPGNAGNDLVKKKRVYHQHAIPHYWIIDPRDESLTVHRWSADGYVEVLLAQRGERVHAEPFGDIELAVGALFGDDEDEPG